MTKNQAAIDYLTSLINEYLVKTDNTSYGEITIKITKVNGKFTRIRKSIEESELVDHPDS